MCMPRVCRCRLRLSPACLPHHPLSVVVGGRCVRAAAAIVMQNRKYPDVNAPILLQRRLRLAESYARTCGDIERLEEFDLNSAGFPNPTPIIAATYVARALCVCCCGCARRLRRGARWQVVGAAERRDARPVRVGDCVLGVSGVEKRPIRQGAAARVVPVPSLCVCWRGHRCVWCRARCRVVHAGCVQAYPQEFIDRTLASSKAVETARDEDVAAGGSGGSQLESFFAVDKLRMEDDDSMGMADYKPAPRVTEAGAAMLVTRRLHWQPLLASLTLRATMATPCRADVDTWRFRVVPLSMSLSSRDVVESS